MVSITFVLCVHGLLSLQNSFLQFSSLQRFSMELWFLASLKRSIFSFLTIFCATRCVLWVIVPLKDLHIKPSFLTPGNTFHKKCLGHLLISSFLFIHPLLPVTANQPHTPFCAFLSLIEFLQFHVLEASVNC